MFTLSINIRERKDRPGKWIVDVKRKTADPAGRIERNQSMFDAYEDAKIFAEQVRRAERKGKLEVLAPPPKPKTLRSVCTAFLAAKAKEVSSETLETYRWLLERSIIKRLNPSLHVDQLTAEAIQKDCDDRAKVVGPVTIRSEWDRLRAMLDYAKRKGLVSANAAAQVKLPKANYATKGWLLSNEVGPFLDSCQLGFHAIAKFALFTGLRRREVVFLQRSDIDLKNKVISVRSKPQYGFRTKSRRDRSVPIDPIILPMLEKHLAHLPQRLDTWLFAQQNGERRSPTSTWFAKSTQDAAERAGISRSITFHDLRRTYGAMLIESGVDVYKVSKLLGHSDVRVTEKIYAPISGKFLASEASKLGRYMGPLLLREALESDTA